MSLPERIPLVHLEVFPRAKPCGQISAACGEWFTACSEQDLDQRFQDFGVEGMWVLGLESYDFRRADGDPCAPKVPCSSVLVIRVHGKRIILPLEPPTSPCSLMPRKKDEVALRGEQVGVVWAVQKGADSPGLGLWAFR